MNGTIKSICVMGLGAACLFISSSASAQPKREGFTMELGIGLGVTMYEDVWYEVSSGPQGTVERTVRERVTRVGLAPLSLSLGGFFNRDFALMARLAGTSYVEDETQFVNSFYGVVGQLWLGDQFFIGGGPGIAVFGPNVFFSRSNVDPVSGFGLNLRVGTMIWSGEGHGFAAVVEALPSWYEDQSVYAGALNIQWQLF